MKRHPGNVQIYIKKYNRSLAWITSWMVLLYLVIVPTLAIMVPSLSHNLIFDVGVCIVVGVFIWSIVSFMGRDISALSLETMQQQAEEGTLAQDGSQVGKLQWLL